MIIHTEVGRFRVDLEDLYRIKVTTPKAMPNYLVHHANTLQATLSYYNYYASLEGLTPLGHIIIETEHDISTICHFAKSGTFIKEL